MKEITPPEVAAAYTDSKNLKEDIILGLVKVFDIPRGFYFVRDCWKSFNHPKYKGKKK